ncbi:MAG: ABC-2 transporter permease [Candidatus Hodarchaeales archaeon]|jgi:ABC-type multidrug transport system permease subunit
MKIQRIIALVKKELKKLTRVPATLFLSLLFPLVLTGAFGLAFGSMGGTAGETVYTIGIVDLDDSDSNWAEYFKRNLSKSDVLTSTTYSTSAQAQADLEQGNIDAFLVIPSNFGDSIDSYFQNFQNSTLWENTTVDLSVDQGSLVLSTAIPPLIQQILIQTLYGEQDLAASLPVRIGAPAQIAAEHFTQFDFMIPGMFAFAAIFITMIVAESFVEERTEGILRRIQVTPTSPAEVITASFIANMIISFLQVTIVFVVAGFMGFNPQGDFIGIAYAFVMVLLLALCNVGFGLIVATLAKTPGAATGLSFIFILPQMFFGTFVPNIPPIVAQFVPSFYATDALTSVLLRGADITSPTVLFDFVIMIGFCVAVIITGIVLFAKFGKDE